MCVADLTENKHLIVWAILAGMLWAVANTLTVFAIRDVGLTIAFPLWNTNSLVGILWGRVLFGELKGASRANVAKVVLGALAIVAAAVLLGFSTIHGDAGHSRHAVDGVLAATGASLLWGTMYIPYRKAYISGMNPLSFVTAFTVGELGSVFALVLAFDGGTQGCHLPFAANHPPAVLAFPGRIRLGHRRPVSAVRSEVPGDWQRHSALQYQPDLGPGVGRAGVRRIGERRHDPQVAGRHWVRRDDPRRTRHQQRCRYGARALVHKRCADARMRPVQTSTISECCEPMQARSFRSAATGAVGGTTSSSRGRRLCLFISDVNARVPALNLDVRWVCVLGAGDDRDSCVVRLGTLEGVEVFLTSLTGD